MLLSIAFCPPVEYFAAIASSLCLTTQGSYNSARFSVEACENYKKQSYRNRCRILTGSGVEDISFPIVHSSENHIPIREVLVDYKTPWVEKAERAISSAYNMSPFFEYYKDEFFDLLEQRPQRLWELDMNLLQWCLKKLGIPVEISLTEAYFPEVVDDFRELVHPKRPNNILESLGIRKPYYQVFAPKFGFQYGLSILDLLFNEGPESVIYLKPLRDID